MDTGLGVAVRSAQQVMDDDARAAREAMEAHNQQPVVLSLAAQIMRHWESARHAKQRVQRRMLEAVRSMRGEYAPEDAQRLQAQGESTIYMMLFATKARQAKALLSDVVMGTPDDKPWALRPTPVADLPPQEVSSIMQAVQEMVLQAENSPQPLSVLEIRQLLRDAKSQVTAAKESEARDRCARAEKKLADIMAEGGFIGALDEFLDDLLMFPTAFLKGPVVRMKGSLVWQDGPEGAVPQVEVKPRPMWERVDPFNVYPAPWATSVNDGYLFERHRLTPRALEELIGVQGYDADAIRHVIIEHGAGGLRSWTGLDSERDEAHGRDGYAGSDELIDALQYWGSVTGQMLLEWGLPPEEVQDAAKVYEVEAWLVGSVVIKALINPDPLARRPYFAASFKRLPGAFWQLGMYDTMRDCQAVCNATARALVGNMGIASGPMVAMNVDRLADGEEITHLYPWKIIQTVNDPTGGNSAPMSFFQPGSNASELMGVFEKFSQLADEYTGVPRYMTGDGTVGGAGRTASGMSMMVTNAGKTVKNLVAHIDAQVVGPAAERGYEFLMRYAGDPDIKGDLNVVARGALALVAKEGAQVRRNEFLQMVLQSPQVMEIVGPVGLAALLRSISGSLDLDVADIVPTDTEIKIRMAQIAAQQQAMQMQQMAQQGQQGGQPPAVTASAQLADGAPVVDNFGA